MKQSKPVILTVFANPNGNLVNLKYEETKIRKLLSPLNARGQIDHINDPSLNLENYFGLLGDWKNQITIFHFGGHANGNNLRLEDIQALFKPLAEELADRNKGLLQLVFLNGCATYQLVQTLFDLKVKAVIATQMLVTDKMAANFAISFYKNLVTGDNLETAYNSAMREVIAQTKINSLQYFLQPKRWLEDYQELIKFKNNDQFPWGLYVNDSTILSKNLLLSESTKKKVFSIKQQIILTVSILSLLSISTYLISHFAAQPSTFSFRVGVKGIPKHLLKNIQVSLKNQRKALNPVGLRDGKLITSLSSKIGTLYFFMKIALYSRKIT